MRPKSFGTSEKRAPVVYLLLWFWFIVKSLNNSSPLSNHGLIVFLCFVSFKVYFCIAIFRHLQQDILRKTQQQHLLIFLKVTSDLVSALGPGIIRKQKLIQRRARAPSHSLLDAPYFAFSSPETALFSKPWISWGILRHNLRKIILFVCLFVFSLHSCLSCNVTGRGSVAWQPKNGCKGD